ncbi:MAG: septum formation initiator family protein [Candidatus Magasanikbacteria bacterium]|nr:septum formation initiator family protein [Candidatus Magasanikbacteria bacterium]
MSTQKINSWKIFFSSKIFILIVAIVAGMVVFEYARAYYQDYLVRQEIAYLEDQTKKLEAKKMELLDVLKYVKSDSFTEEKARTELNMVKPGEQVLVVSQLASENGRQEKNAVVKWDNIPNYKKWLKYFFN